MASNEEEGSTVIAIDRDKNSQYAVKWGVDHLLKRNSACTLIHVRTKPLHPHDFNAATKQGRPPTEEELHQFFLPFRGFCARKGIVAKELVLHDIDVPNALSDYVIDNSVSSIVVGASNWNVFRRIFKDADVAASLIRSLPESCTVHVVSKRKVQSIQPVGRSQNASSIKATRSLKETTTLKGNSQSEDLNRKSFRNGIWRRSSNDRVSIDQNKVASCKSIEETNSPRPSDESTSGPLGSQLSTETSHENQDAVTNSNISRSNSPTKSPKSLEKEIKKSEMMKLKLELKKTTQEYTTACSEAVTAKQKAMELEKLRQEEEQNIEKTRLAEETELALAEVERQKSKVLKESAEMSRCLAAIEMQKTKQTKIRAMNEDEEKKRALDTSPPDNILCKIYNIKEIEAATHYFDKAMKLGEGGYGPVYKGVLDDSVVAIKALRPDITQGERQFQQEVDVLSTVRHPNIIQLLGACPEYGCLVYEFMEKGTLEDRLFQKDNTPPIPWKIRFKIASEIATGLLFLHQTNPEPIVHRDLKPENILLDKNYVTKIADVGLARLVPPSVANKTTQYHMTAAAGTFFYIDPEYQQSGLLGVKSDIYSLGVVLLQLITGKSPMGVAHWVEEVIHDGKFHEVLDPSVTDWPVEETLSLAKLALKCCEMRKRDRPDLATVILPELNRLRDLGGATDTDIVPAREEGMSSNADEEMENSR